MILSFLCFNSVSYDGSGIAAGGGSGTSYLSVFVWLADRFLFYICFGSFSSIFFSLVFPC